MGIARVPVYLWAPMMPGVGVLRAPERVVGAIANRCAIGTTLIRQSRPNRLQRFALGSTND